MELVPVLIAVVVMLAMAGVLGWLSLKTWRWVHMAVATLVFLSTFFFFYLAARTLKTHQAWRDGVREHEQTIAALRKNIAAMQHGGQAPDGETPGVLALKTELFSQTVARGEVWRKIKPDGRVDAASGAVKLVIEELTLHGITVNSVLYLFAEGEGKNAGQYLGKFRVTAAGEKTVEVAPYLPMSAAEIDRADRAASGSWSAYFVMPVDDPAYLAKLPDEQRQTLFQGLQRDEQAELAKADRAPRDYDTLFAHAGADRESLDLEIAAATAEIERLKQSTKMIEAAIAYRTQEQADLRADRQKFVYERGKTGELVKQLERHLAQETGKLKTSRAATVKHAAELKALQAKLINAVGREQPLGNAGSITLGPQAAASKKS